MELTFGQWKKANARWFSHGDDKDDVVGGRHYSRRSADQLSEILNVNSRAFVMDARNSRSRHPDVLSPFGEVDIPKSKTLARARLWLVFETAEQEAKFVETSINASFGVISSSDAKNGVAKQLQVPYENGAVLMEHSPNRETNIGCFKANADDPLFANLCLDARTQVSSTIVFGGNFELSLTELARAVSKALIGFADV